MTYESKFKPEQFLEVLDNTKPATTAYVMRAVGCSRDTCSGYLATLQQIGKIRRLETLGCKEILWVRTI